ncbi:hypothetical protein [Desulfobacter curvatus]|nr:hypothetical protein [Desulfobacter curvatus]
MKMSQAIKNFMAYQKLNSKKNHPKLSVLPGGLLKSIRLERCSHAKAPVV